jgi:hypothetical protein
MLADLYNGSPGFDTRREGRQNLLDELNVEMRG